MICAVDERTVIFGHEGGTVRPAKLSPGDVLIFRGDKCHRGSGLEIDRPAALLATHIFLNPVRGEDVGLDTLECVPHRRRLTREALVDSSRLKERLIPLPPHVETPPNERSENFSCQLCRALLPKNAVKKAYTMHCNRCHVTLCADVCWNSYHDGVGLEGKVTIEAYIETKLERNRRHQDWTPVYQESSLPPVHLRSNSVADAPEDVTMVYPKDG